MTRKLGTYQTPRKAQGNSHLVAFRLSERDLEALRKACGEGESLALAARRLVVAALAAEPERPPSRLARALAPAPPARVLAARPEVDPVGEALAADTRRGVLGAIRQTAKATPGGLVFLPGVGRAVGLEPEAFAQIALELARARALELRPESGVGLLSDDERAWCPVGAGGEPLSYARVLR